MDGFRAIHRGSMPALLANENPPDIEQFYASYVQTYLQRDIQNLSQIGDELTFLHFLTALASRTGQILHYAEIARDLGISQPTVKRWISLLRTAGIITLIEPWYNNRLSRIIKAPKLYFMDTGLAAYLARWTTPETLEAGAASGAFFETFVVTELLKSWYHNGKIPPLYYYRDKDQQEIDLILEVDGIIYPIEIKKTANPSKDMIKSFRMLNKTDKQIGNGTIICCASEFFPLDATTKIVPWWMI